MNLSVRSINYGPGKEQRERSNAINYHCPLRCSTMFEIGHGEAPLRRSIIAYSNILEIGHGKVQHQRSSHKLSLPGSMLMVGHGKAQHKRITFWIMTDWSNIFDVGHGTAYHQRSSYVNYHRPVQYTGGWSRQGATSAAQEQQAGQEQQCKYMHFT